MIDLALLSANAAQLKYILTNWDQHEYHMLLLCLVVSSICLQVNRNQNFIVRKAIFALEFFQKFLHLDLFRFCKQSFVWFWAWFLTSTKWIIINQLISSTMCHYPLLWLWSLLMLWSVFLILKVFPTMRKNYINRLGTPFWPLASHNSITTIAF